jgi:hypothetical protein
MTVKIPPQPSRTPSSPVLWALRAQVPESCFDLHWKRADGATEYEGIPLDQMIRHRMAFVTEVDVVRYGWSDEARLFVWSWEREKIPPEEIIDWPHPPAGE